MSDPVLVKLRADLTEAVAEALFQLNHGLGLDAGMSRSIAKADADVAVLAVMPFVDAAVSAVRAEEQERALREALRRLDGVRLVLPTQNGRTALQMAFNEVYGVLLEEA